MWSESAEIVKYTYSGGWSNSARFDTMLRNVYLPVVIQGAPDKNGNWELIMMDAAVGIAVHLDDATSYNKAMSIFTGRVPAYVYTTSDGSQPAYPPRSSINTTSELVSYWFGQSTFVNGLAQETCRDFGHTGWGLDAISHVAETARLQGTDLWSQLATRMRSTYEFHMRLRQRRLRPVLALRRQREPRRRARHRDRVQRAPQPARTQPGQHPEVHPGPPPRGHRRPLDRLGDPHPRRHRNAAWPPTTSPSPSRRPRAA